MGWLSQDEMSEAGTVHVWPEYESGHVVDDSRACWCSPDSEHYENGNTMIVHRDELDRLELVP